MCPTDTTCTKTFTDADTYARERDVYTLGLDYVPRLVAHDDATRTLTVERVGTALASTRTSGLPFWRHDRSRNSRIDALRRRFYVDTGLHHNDVQYKNVLYDASTDRLYLIDFELASPTERDNNADRILCTAHNDVTSLLVVVALVVALVAGVPWYVVMSVVVAVGADLAARPPPGDWKGASASAVRAAAKSASIRASSAARAPPFAPTSRR